MSHSVLKEWTKHLTLQMQGTLICAMRGPDGSPKNDPAKALVRRFRSILTNNAFPLGPKNSFAGDGSGIIKQEEIDAFFASVDQYQHHWYNHFFHAAEIVGYKHHDKEVAKSWLDFYLRCCKEEHLNPETEEQLDERLKGNGP